MCPQQPYHPPFLPQKKWLSLIAACHIGPRFKFRTSPSRFKNQTNGTFKLLCHNRNHQQGFGKQKIATLHCCDFNLKLVSATFIKFLFFHQVIALQKLWMFFSHVKSYFHSRDIQMFVIFPLPDSKGQMEVE